MKFRAEAARDADQFRRRETDPERAELQAALALLRERSSSADPREANDFDEEGLDRAARVSERVPLAQVLGLLQDRQRRMSR